MPDTWDSGSHPDIPRLVGELTCAQEPIHTPGNIQPHGALLVVDPASDFTVVGASRNAAVLLDAAATTQMVGSTLATVLGVRFADTVRERHHSDTLSVKAPWQSILSFGDRPTAYEVAVHAHEGLVLIELERAGVQEELHAHAIISQLQRAILDLREAGGDLDALARVTARGVRLLSGYERVMVYRFDTGWNGQTIAEDKVADWDQSFDQIVCPASDIPVQARELYQRSPMRYVADRDIPQVPVDIDPTWSGARPPPHAIDLSFARLRSQSPVHLQIHRNLGINGSMSLSILYKERLWGLMICHSRQPHYPSSSQRSAAAALTDAFVLRVGPVERTESEQARRKDLGQLSALLAHMANADVVVAALTTGDVTINKLFTSSGTAVLYEGDIALLEHTPSEADVRELAGWLRTHSGSGTSFHTDNLGALFPSWQRHMAVASGVMAVFLSNDRADMLLWFRPEEPQLVSWGSSSQHQAAPDGPLLPAHPYEKWETTRHGFAKPWAEWEVELAETLRHFVTEVMVRSLRRIGELNEGLRQSQKLEAISQLEIGRTMHRANEVLEAKVRAQQAQHAVEAQFRFASQAGGLGVWELDLRTNEFTASAMCKKNFGRDQDAPFTYDELLGAIRPEDRERTKAAMTHSVATGADYKIETPIVRSNGTPGWVQMQAQVLHAADGAEVGLAGISLDITERVLSQERIRQSQRIEAIGRMTAGVAHDFNNVLQALLGGIELAIDDVADRPAVSANLELALQAGLRGARLTSHLLSFSRQQILRPAALDLGPLLQTLSRTLTRTLGRDITINVEIAANLPHVLADAAHLDSALLNLALNARDAMPQGGELLITAEATGTHVAITVADTGEGMAPEVMAQACEPFFTTKGLKGSGLGLSMVQGFARQSGGELSIQSVRGQGTRIEITLPLALPLTPSELTVPPERVQGQGRVLIVDDEVDVGRVTAAFLHKAGFHVTMVGEANAALQKLRTGFAFDALVTDYAMPGMNGAELVRYARELCPKLPILIITGYAGAGGLDNLPPDVTILRKPFQRDDLTRRVKDLVESDMVAL